jgi:hypothetical protein
MKNFRDYLSESEEAATNPVAGDTFAINIREECLIESVVVESRDDGVVIAADDRMMQLLESYGYTFEQTCMECGGSGCGCGQAPEEYGDETDAGQNPGEYDQEGDMAKDELLTVIRSARKLIGMLDNDDNMPEWTQKKITKSADYVDTAADYIASQKERGVMEQGVAEGAKEDMSKEVKAMATGTCPHCQGPVKKKEYPTLTQYHCAKCGIRASQDKPGVTEGSGETSPVARAVLHRIMMRHPGLLAAHGPERVMAAVDELADRVNIGPDDEIGSSDVSAYVREVERALSEQGVAEGLDEAVGGNYLYHATGGLKEILQSGAISAARGPQDSTKAQTKLPTVSTTRDWGYASGSNAGNQMAGIGRDAIVVLDRNAVESNFKTLGTSQSTNIKGLAFNPYLTKDGVARSQNTDAMARNIAKAKAKYAEPTAKAGGEFEEAVVVPKGSLPIQGTMVGFWVNPKSELMQDPVIMNDPRRLDMVRPNQFVKATQQKGVAEGGFNDDGSYNTSDDEATDFDEYDFDDTELGEAEYQGRKVPLGKKMKGDVKKSKVYVKNPQGNVVKVNFGDPNMKIRKSNPGARKSFRARHNCDNPGPRHKARYWSCRAW